MWAAIGIAVKNKTMEFENYHNQDELQGNVYEFQAKSREEFVVLDPTRTCPEKSGCAFGTG